MVCWLNALPTRPRCRCSSNYYFRSFSVRQSRSICLSVSLCNNKIQLYFDIALLPKFRMHTRRCRRYNFIILQSNCERRSWSWSHGPYTLHSNCFGRCSNLQLQAELSNQSATMPLSVSVCVGQSVCLSVCLAICLSVVLYLSKRERQTDK